MIGPKRQKQTTREKEDAYELATLRDSGACVMPPDIHGPCVGAVHRDHRQNRDEFNTVVENLQLLCARHHEWKTNHPAVANRDGWGCPRYEQPRNWPARRVVDGRLVWVRYLPVAEYVPPGFVVITAEQAADMRRGFPIGEAA